MKQCLLFPCSKSGKILKGFCPTVCITGEDILRTVSGYVRFRVKFGIKYYSLDGHVVSLL